MALDRNNVNIGYRLGRLFALLERCQEAVSPGINATIGDRFFGSASGTPVVAFPLLIRLNRNHLKKLRQEKPGYAVNLEKEIQEIVDGIEGRFPAHLDLDNQGRFAIGYYHQRQDFFSREDASRHSRESGNPNGGPSVHVDSRFRGNDVVFSGNLHVLGFRKKDKKEETA